MKILNNLVAVITGAEKLLTSAHPEIKQRGHGQC